MKVQTELLYSTHTHTASTILPVIPAFLNKFHKVETKDILLPLFLLFDACSGRSFEVAKGVKKKKKITGVISHRVQLSKTPPQNHFGDGMEVKFAPGEEM